MITRRSLLKWSVAAAIPLIAWDAAKLVGPLGTMANGNSSSLYASEVAMGTACADGITPTLKRKLIRHACQVLSIDATGLADAARPAFEEIRRRDFEVGRTVNIHGWILSETEVGVWLAHADIHRKSSLA